jgi:hypothetical protein
MHPQLSQTFDLLSPTDLNAVCFKAEEDFEIKESKKVAFDFLSRNYATALASG